MAIFRDYMPTNKVLLTSIEVKTAENQTSLMWLEVKRKGITDMPSI